MLCDGHHLAGTQSQFAARVWAWLPQPLLLTVPRASLTTLSSVSFAHHFPLLNYFVRPAVMSFGTNASFTIQFTSVLFSLVGAIKIAPLGNNVIANKSK